jgi:DNA-binding transcriptional LysR family regulator
MKRLMEARESDHDMRASKWLPRIFARCKRGRFAGFKRNVSIHDSCQATRHGRRHAVTSWRSVARAPDLQRPHGVGIGIGPRSGSSAALRPEHDSQSQNDRTVAANGTRGLIDEFLRSSNVPVHQIDGIAGMLNLVRTTTWSALLPFIAVSRILDDDGVVISSISNGIIPMDYFLTHLSTAPLSSAAKAFINALNDALGPATVKQAVLAS